MSLSVEAMQMSEVNAMRVALLSLAFILVASGMQCHGQQQTFFADTVLYNAVLDELFQTQLGDFKDHTKTDDIVLRFSSSNARELQIKITERRSHPPVYVLWRIPKDQPSIWEQVAAASSRLHTEDPKQIAATIRLERQAVDHPSERFEKLLKAFSGLRFSPAFSAGLILDGSQYDLWFQSLSNSTRFSLEGSPNGQPSDHPLILWMIAVKSEVDK